MRRLRDGLMNLFVKTPPESSIRAPVASEWGIIKGAYYGTVGSSFPTRGVPLMIVLLLLSLLVATFILKRSRKSRGSYHVRELRRLYQLDAIMSSGTDERLCDHIQQRNGNFIEGFVSVVDQTETKPKKYTIVSPSEGSKGQAEDEDEEKEEYPFRTEEEEEEEERGIDELCLGSGYIDGYADVLGADDSASVSSVCTTESERNNWESRSTSSSVDFEKSNDDKSCYNNHNKNSSSSGGGSGDVSSSSCSSSSSIDGSREDIDGSREEKDDGSGDKYKSNSHSGCGWKGSPSERKRRESSNIVTVLYFYTDWCTPCKEAKPKWLQLARLVRSKVARIRKSCLTHPNIPEIVSVGAADPRTYSSLSLNANDNDNGGVRPSVSTSSLTSYLPQVPAPSVRFLQTNVDGYAILSPCSSPSPDSDSRSPGPGPCPGPPSTTQADEVREICDRFCIRALPSFVVIRDGKVEAMLEGWDRRKLLAAVKNAAGLR